MANGTYISVSGTKGTQNWTLVIPDLDYEAISTKIGDGVTQYGETLGFRIPLVIRTESEGEYRWGNMQFSVMVTNDTSDDPLDTASSTAFATALESSSDGGLTGANSTTMVKTVISSGTTGNNLIVQGKFGTPTSLFGIAGDPGLASERTVVITKNFNGAPSETHVITGTSSYSSIWDSNLNNVEVVGNGSYSFEGSTGFREVTVSGGGVGCTYMNRMFKGTMAGGTATLDLSRFSGRFVQDYVYFCENCTSLTTIKMPSPSVMSDGSETTLGGHFKSHCAPLVTNSTILINGDPGETYNIGGNNEVKNIDIVNHICSILDRLKPRHNKNSYKDLITYVEDRPGHDFRYAIDSSKIQNKLGWKPVETFKSGINKTILWYIENEPWWRNIQKNNYNQERLGL